MNNDFDPNDWENEDWDEYDEYEVPERRRSSRKLRYAFAGLLIFFMWLVKRDKKNAAIDADFDVDEDEVEIEE